MPAATVGGRGATAESGWRYAMGARDAEFDGRKNVVRRPT